MNAELSSLGKTPDLFYAPVLLLRSSCGPWAAICRRAAEATGPVSSTSLLNMLWGLLSRLLGVSNSFTCSTHQGSSTIEGGQDAGHAMSAFNHILFRRAMLMDCEFASLLVTTTSNYMKRQSGSNQQHQYEKATLHLQLNFNQCPPSAPRFDAHCENQTPDILSSSCTSPNPDQPASARSVQHPPVPAPWPVSCH
jgi:hypothetical protein